MLMSDGEQAKGQVAEARRFAQKYGLSNITVVIDCERHPDKRHDRYGHARQYRGGLPRRRVGRDRGGRPRRERALQAP